MHKRTSQRRGRDHHLIGLFWMLAGAGDWWGSKFNAQRTTTSTIGGTAKEGQVLALTDPSGPMVTVHTGSPA